MNELQIRLTADIKDLQSALTKAKQTLKSFETETATDIAKSNQERGKTLGLIDRQIARAKELKVSLGQATNEQQVAKLNAKLEQTSIELARLNALGKNFTAPAVKSFNQLKSSVGAANGSAVAFNRIIQDAPFGLMGVGNNIQQFTEQISFLKQSTGSTGAALKSFFSSLITPTNLLILGVSAVTAGFTAFQMGAFDSAEETRDLVKELDDYKSSLDGIAKSQLDGLQNSAKEVQSFKLLKIQAENANLPLAKRLLAVEELKKQYPDYLKNLSNEQILTGNVGLAYDKLTDSIIASAKARAGSQQIIENEQKIFNLLNQEAERALQILDLRTQKEKLLAQQIRGQQGPQFVSAQDVGLGKQIRDIEGEINDKIQQTITSKEDRNKLSSENLFIESKIKDQIVEAGGLLEENVKPIKDANENLEKLRRSFDLNIADIERFGAADKKRLEDGLGLTESLIAEQKNLFNAIANLKQAQDIGFNPTLLLIYEGRLQKIDAAIGSIASKRVDTEIAPVDPSALEAPLIQDEGLIEGLEKQIASFEKLKKVTSDPTMLALYSSQIINLKNQLASLNGEGVKSNLQLIADAFGSMGQQIANSLNISNRSLRGFVTTLVSATPKIISALMDQAKANANASGIKKAANLTDASGNVIVSATETAKGLGPVGLAVLPVLIAGGLALISAAFGKSSGGGGSPSAGQGSTFTNRREFGGPVSKGRAYIVGEKRPELFVPNTNGIIVPQLPSMDYSGASMAAGAMAVDVNIRGISYGDDILFTVQQAQIRRGIR